MEISLSGVIPYPLKEHIKDESDIWNKDITFQKGLQYIVDAQSGRGKSTFIQSLYGIRKDYDGEIKYDDLNVREMRSDDMAAFRQRNISILFQDLRLFPDLTAWDNIHANACLAASPRAEKVEEMAEQLQVTHILHKKTFYLSYGERQRIATIRALVQPFDWLLMDEPWSHLDKENTLASYKLICEVVEEQSAGMIMTTLGEDHFLSIPNHLYL